MRRGSRSARLTMGVILAVIGAIVIFMGHVSGFIYLSYFVGILLLFVGVQLARNKLNQD